MRSPATYFSKAPQLAVAPVDYTQGYQEGLNSALRLYFAQVDNFVNGPRPHGVCYSTSTQTNPVGGDAMAVTFNASSGMTGVTVNTSLPDSKIYVAQSGVYSFDVSVQLDKTGGSADAVYFWYRVNGTNAANSAAKVVVGGTADEGAPTRRYIVSLQQNDYFQLMWSSADTNMVLSAVAASSPVPAIPSALVSVAWVSPISV